MRASRTWHCDWKLEVRYSDLSLLLTTLAWKSVIYWGRGVECLSE